MTETLETKVRGHQIRLRDIRPGYSTLRLLNELEHNRLEPNVDNVMAEFLSLCAVMSVDFGLYRAIYEGVLSLSHYL